MAARRISENLNKECSVFRKIAMFTIAAVLVWSTAGVAADVYEIDPVHSHASFKIRHLVGKVTGRFDKLSGSINVDTLDMTKSSVALTIETASIDTDNDRRDNHLRSADFFDAENNPEITFKSSKIEKTGDNMYDVTGDFTMHGVTRSITIPVELLGLSPTMRGEWRAGFEAEFDLKRSDYGLEWNRTLEAGGLLLGDDVEVDIGIESVKSPDE